MGSRRIQLNSLWIVLLGCFLAGCTKSHIKNYNLGVDHYQKQNYTLSVEFLQKAIVLNPKWAYGYYGLGMNYYKMARYTEAESQFLKALELKPNDTQFLMGLGLVYYQQGKKELAAVSFRRSFEIQPDPDNTYNLGVVLRELGRYGEARPLLEIILKTSRTPEVLENMAICYEGEGNTEEARKTWKAALDLQMDPLRNEWVLAHLSDLVERAEPPVATQQPLSGGQETFPLTILVYTPSMGSKCYDEMVHLYAKIMADAGVDDVKILLNGIEFSKARGMEIQKSQEIKQAEYIDINVPANPGINELEIRVTDRTGKSVSETVQFVRIQPRLFGLFAGVSRYKDTNIPALSYADRDAEALYEFFNRQKSFEEIHLKLLTNEEATRANITEALAYFLARSAPHDLVIIFLAGHGMQEAGEYFFIPHDAVKDNLFGTAIKDVEFKSSMRRVGAKRLLLFTDTCHSGGILTADRGGNAAQKFFETLTEVEGRVTITASKFDEVSLEYENVKHGIFSYYLLKGLEGEADLNSDNLVGVMELYRFISQKIPDVTRGGQHPVIIMPEGSLVGDIPISLIQK